MEHINFTSGYDKTEIKIVLILKQQEIVCHKEKYDHILIAFEKIKTILGTLGYITPEQVSKTTNDLAELVVGKLG